MSGSERDIYRVALELIRDKRHEDGSLITGREAEAIAFAALSDGAGLADPSDLSRAPVAGVSPSVSYPVTLLPISRLLRAAVQRELEKIAVIDHIASTWPYSTDERAALDEALP